MEQLGHELALLWDASIAGGGLVGHSDHSVGPRGPVSGRGLLHAVIYVTQLFFRQLPFDVTAMEFPPLFGLGFLTCSWSRLKMYFSLESRISITKCGLHDSGHKLRKEDI